MDIENQISDDSKTYDDMVEMAVLNQSEILKNVSTRYKQDKIFTLIGPTLIVMNPYKQISNLFDDQVMQMISEQAKQKQEMINLQQSSKEYPHIYSISASAYESVFKSNINQAIVISGESGAGKTENAKYAMRYLTQLSTKKNNQEEVFQSRKISDPNRIRASSVSTKTIEQQILFCNPIMEAFGNAKTARNNNSSRFGKYVSILVECTTQKILGAQIQKYLLEKSRVTHIANQERNYHIFYHLLSNKKIVEDLQISSNPSDYNFLNQSGIYTADQINDSKLFQEVQNSFQSMGFLPDKILTIWQILASILLLGNIQFTQEEEDKVEIKNKDVLTHISKLLLCDEQLIQKALTIKILETGKNQLEVPLKENECVAMRNSLSKILYDRLFTWLVQQLNSAINPPALKQVKSLSIGLLDIFGFENFQINSFEQLCINYTNERLQKLYISYVFIQEEKILREDGLGQYLNNLSYQDNQPVVDLIDSKEGILELLNDQCKNKGGTDKKFLESLKSLSNKFEKIQFPKIQKSTFIIKHTATDVEYSSEDFCDKNKDEVSKQIESCIRQSKNQIVVSIFSIEGNETTNQMQKDKFLGEKFRNQMNDLMNVLNSCQVHFVRCIKPNETKEMDNFVEQYVAQQIQYLGVLESIEVRKQMYPFRKTYSQFYELFYLIDEQLRKSGKPKNISQSFNFRQSVEQLIQRNFPHFNQKVCLYGNTKIYLKAESERELDFKKQQILKQLHDQAVLQIQTTSTKFFQVKKCSLLNSLKSFSIDFRLKFRLRNILIMGDIKISNTIKKAFMTWKCIKDKLKEQEIENQKKQKQKQQEEELKRKKKQIEDEEERKNQSLKNDEYYEEYEKNMANYIASDSKSNMHLINQQETEEETQTNLGDTKRNLIYQLNECNYNDNLYNNMRQNNQDSYYSNSMLDQSSNYQSVIDQSYASITGIKLHEQEDQKRVNELIQKEGGYDKQSDNLISQYTSIAKYYTGKKELTVSPPIDEECQSPPLILQILEKQHSYQEPAQQDQINDILYLQFIEKDVSRSILDDFKRFELDEYLKQVLKKRSKNIFQTKKVEEIMVVSHKQLSSSLTKLTKEEDKKAVEVFKDILKLMQKKDQKDNEQIDIIIYSILNNCMNTSLNFKDEIMLQMLKQINNNKSKTEIIRVLQLMTAFTYMFKASLNTIHCALQFLYTIFNSLKQKQIDEFQSKQFQYLINKLIKDRKRKQSEKKYLLTSYQIRYLINLKQIIFPLILPNGSQYCINIDPTFQISDLKQRALDLMEIPKRINQELFGIYKISDLADSYEEKLFSDTEYVWDLISELECKKLAYQNQNKVFDSFFLLKVKYGYKFSPSDAVSISYFYQQSKIDIISKKILLTREDNLKISCLNIYINYEPLVENNIDDIYQNSESLSQEEKEKTAQEITTLFQQLQPYLRNQLQAKLEYISVLSKYDEYMGWILRNVTVKLDQKSFAASININPFIIVLNPNENKKENKIKIPTDCISNQFIENESYLILKLKQSQKKNQQPLPNMVILETPFAQQIFSYFSQYIELIKEQYNETDGYLVNNCDDNLNGDAYESQNESSPQQEEFATQYY
ncbi:myosin head protein (macronuclear) [Tetrahymena thermophila SB210]|uniref:Myosin head protein n=2 Tax=Tetrahymena thermophila TaxID=5911 RepID=I7MJG4_TETTS|nr:myosin head protein [Tetrahymena thermophila SB210]EAS06250.2 myosin head protein [Tetrahymena thermophila SB210]BAE16259.1 myosin 9 [Tetrahymena thermophila]|eukprot:XP_001026495.2 myosin head protein [Tetrahymena thermophila SB210]